MILRTKFQNLSGVIPPDPLMWEGMTVQCIHVFWGRAPHWHFSGYGPAAAPVDAANTQIKYILNPAVCCQRFWFFLCGLKYCVWSASTVAFTFSAEQVSRCLWGCSCATCDRDAVDWLTEVFNCCTWRSPSSHKRSLTPMHRLLPSVAVVWSVTPCWGPSMRRGAVGERGRENARGARLAVCIDPCCQSHRSVVIRVS